MADVDLRGGRRAARLCEARLMGEATMYPTEGKDARVITSGGAYGQGPATPYGRSTPTPVDRPTIGTTIEEQSRLIVELHGTLKVLEERLQGVLAPHGPGGANALEKAPQPQSVMQWLDTHNREVRGVIAQMLDLVNRIEL